MTTPSRRDSDDPFDAEPPPDYTPRPAAQSGEETLEIAPPRGRPPPQTAPPDSGYGSGYNSGWGGGGSWQAPQNTGSAWNGGGGGAWGGGPSGPSQSWGQPGPWQQQPPQSQSGLQRASSVAPQTGPPASSQVHRFEPTSTPVPGKPLIRKGKVLSYPASFYCPKCQNTGYKATDPSNPCRKCWEQFSIHYHDSLAYAPARAGTAWQRPLPSQNRSSTAPPPGHQHSASLGTYPGNYPQPSPGPGGGGGGGGGWGSSPYPQQQFIPMPAYGPPPPGAVIVQPGDPRIGGRLCYNCSGSGQVTTWFLDVVNCKYCNGMGRILGP